MKQVLRFFAGCILAISIFSGYEKVTAADSNDRLDVITTIFAPYDFVREIVGDKADITMLLPPASESHSFEPSPQDMVKILNCDIFIYVGGVSDKWVDKFLDVMEPSNQIILTLIDCVEPVEEEIVEGMEAHEEDEETAFDEHVWTSPINAKLIVSKIRDALCEADIINAPFYKENTDIYLQKLDELDAAFTDVITNAVRKTIIFGDRFPFRYLADTYGLDYFAAFPGCSTDSEPSAKTITFLIDKVIEEKIPVIFHNELSNKKIAGIIAESTGAKVLQLHACHNISRNDFKNGISYLDLMNQNVNALREALK